MSDLIRRQDAIDALEREKTYCTAFREGYTQINVFEKYNAGLTDGIKALKNLPSAQSEPTLYGYPIEHLAMIARVMAKENCTPEVVAQILQNAGEIAKMVRDEMLEMLKESVERGENSGAIS